MSDLWQAHEDDLTAPLLDAVAGNDRLRLLGPAVLDVNDGHRCPTIAVSPTSIEPEALQDALIVRGVQTTASHFYGWRCLEGMGVDPERGALRLSFVHYTTAAEVDRVIQALDEIVS